MKRISNLTLSVLFLVLALGGCSEDEKLLDEETRMVFDVANSKLHSIHLDSFSDPPWETGVSIWPCELGSVEMNILDDGTEVDFDDGVDLDHEFSSCELNEIVVDGNIDYKNVIRCANGGFEFDIEGMITTSLLGECAIDAREQCDGTYTGKFCGLTF